MSLSTSVLIVSVFGRGHSLAMELAAKDIPVTLLDVSEQLGLTPPEEWEGPFGLNQAGLTSIQRERLNEDDPIVRQTEGITFVLPSGPVELRGPVAEHRMEKLGIKKEIRDLLRIERLSDSEAAKIGNLPVAQTWPLLALRNFNGNQYQEGREAFKLPMSFTSEAEVSFRQVSRLGIQKSLEAAGRRLVNIKKPGTLRDISSIRKSGARKVEFSEAGIESSETIQYEMLVWCLTSEETHFASSAICARLFPAGPQAAIWYWNKYRFRLAESPERESLPFHSIWIDHIDFPMTHENFYVVQRTANPELFDIWCRLPLSMRFQRSYLHERAQYIVRRFAKQSEALKAELSEEPTTGHQTFEKTGPTRFPIFAGQGKGQGHSAGSGLEAVLFHSPEVWSGLGWSHLFEHDQNLLSKLETWWKKSLEEKAKKSGREKEKSL